MTVPAVWHDDDIEAQLKGCGGVAVVHGAETGWGLYDSPTVKILDGMATAMIAGHKLLTVRALSFPLIKNGESITVGGMSATVIGAPEKSGDGALLHLVIK